MNIIHVSDVFLRYGGGAPNVIKELAKHQITQGHRVLVVTFQSDPTWPFNEAMEGIPIRRTPLKTGCLPFYLTGYKNMQRLASDIQSTFQPDILHLHMPFSGLAVLSRLTNTPAVYTFHGSWAEEYEVEAGGIKRRTGLYLLERMLMRSIEKRALSQADTIITLSRFMQQRARKYNICPPHGWAIVHSGVDLTNFKVESEQTKANFRRSINVHGDQFLILTVRRLAKRMGLENLIRAIDLVRGQIPGVFLIIGGKGELKESLKLKIQNLKLEHHVRLEGFIPDQDLPQYYAMADLFIMPTQELEGFGLTILESMACGTPVLGTPVGAIPEVIGPFNKGLVLRGATSEDIAEGIIKYYNRYYQSGDKQIGDKARLYAERFSWKKMALEYERIYGKATNARNKISKTRNN